MEEIWKVIDLFGKKYEVSNLGKIKNKTGKILKGYKSSGGYLYIDIHENGNHHHPRIHRVVAEAFVDNPNNLPQVNHINGIKTDNRGINLEWCSAKENIRHAYKNGLYDKHKGFKRTKVNQYDLQGNLIKQWDCMRDIEKKYNVTHTAIRFCCLGRIKTCKGYIWKYASEVM